MHIRATDRVAWPARRLSGLQSLSAEDFHSHLRYHLDKHTPATRQKVPSRRSAPWFTAVGKKVRAARQQGRRAQRQWFKTGLTIHKQINSRAKKCVTKLVHATKTSCFCSMVRDSLSCKQLFRITSQLFGRKIPHAHSFSSRTTSTLSWVLSQKCANCHHQSWV